MKICVIGNSHVGSLSRGWDVFKGDYPEHEITFFAQRSEGINGLIVRSGKLIPDNQALARALEFTSGGKCEVDPAEYDVFLIYGSGANINAAQNGTFYSSAALEMSISDQATGTLSFNLLKRLRTVTAKAIFVGHLPLVPAIKVSSDIKSDDYFARVELMNKLIYGPLNAELVKQPMSTVVNGGNTHPAFSKGSKALAIGDCGDNTYHSEDDTDHMNDRFGEIWLRNFLQHYVEKLFTSGAKAISHPCSTEPA